MEMTPQYSTVLFCDVWEDYNQFKTDLEDSMFNNIIDVKEESLKIIYALLCARYANNPIANNDINQFENKVFGIMFQYAPTWEKRLDIQSKLRHLSDEDILKGSKAIYNNALNPDGSPATQSLEELSRINSQSTTNYKKSRMDAYAQLWDLLSTDVTGEFINKFKVCFKQFVKPEQPILFYQGEDN